MAASRLCDEREYWFAEPDGNVEACSTLTGAAADSERLQIWNTFLRRQIILGNENNVRELLRTLRFQRRTKKAPVVARHLAYENGSIKIRILREKGKVTSRRDVSSSTFTLSLYITARRRTLYARQIPIKLLLRAKHLQRLFRTSCENRSEGELDTPSAYSLESVSSTSKRGVYTTCVTDESMFGDILKEGQLYVCPKERPFFNGRECRSEYFECGRDDEGMRWKTQTIADDEYFECVNCRAERKQCETGYVFDGKSCVALYLDGCAGKPDGFHVACDGDRYSYRTCELGKASSECLHCPPHKPIFVRNKCTSALCVDDDNAVNVNFLPTKDITVNHVAISCVDGEAIVRERRYLSSALQVFKRFLELVVAEVDSIDKSDLSEADANEFFPLHWFPMWPPWISAETTSMMDALDMNAGQMTLWHIGCVHGASAFSHALLTTSRKERVSGKHKTSLTFQQSTRDQIACLYYRENLSEDIVPYAPVAMITPISDINSLTEEQSLEITPFESSSSKTRCTRDSNKHNTDNINDGSGRFVFSEKFLTLGDKGVVLEVRRDSLQRRYGYFLLVKEKLCGDDISKELPTILVPNASNGVVKVPIGDPIPANPLLFACSNRAWTCYYPTESNELKAGAAKSLCLVNSAAALAFAIQINRSEPKTCLRRSKLTTKSSDKYLGFRTFSYYQQQTIVLEANEPSFEAIIDGYAKGRDGDRDDHNVKSIKARIRRPYSLITVKQNEFGNIERITSALQFPVHSFLSKSIADYKCRNAFNFASIKFASIHSIREAYVSDTRGNIRVSIECEETGTILSFPFDSYNFSDFNSSSVPAASSTTTTTTITNAKPVESDKRETSSVMSSPNKCRVRVRMKRYNGSDEEQFVNSKSLHPSSISSQKQFSRLAVFGVGVFFDKTPYSIEETVFLPVGFPELGVLPRNVTLSLPHLPLNIYVDSSGFVTLTLVDDISSDYTLYQRAQCVSGGGYWDYVKDECVTSFDRTSSDGSSETIDSASSTTSMTMTEDILKTLFSL